MESKRMVPQVNESDWRVFRQKLPEWQERHMETLLQEYAALIAGPGAASDRFWALGKRIKADKRQTGVVAQMSRSNMYLNIIDLLSEGAITLQDLDSFSDELREKMVFVMRDRV